MVMAMTMVMMMILQSMLMTVVISVALSLTWVTFQSSKPFIFFFSLGRWEAVASAVRSAGPGPVTGASANGRSRLA